MAGKRIDREEVGKVARLAGLELGEDEIDRLTADLAKVLAHFGSLERLDTRDVPPASEVLSAAAPLRPDEVRPGLAHDEALANAPAHEDGAFVVPRILTPGKAGG
jgi:aspartyl-tRNA(Asn)/glutamyl-tRNA(Gln) amidotransferase subunit C